jgi:hypothetical protein
MTKKDYKRIAVLLAHYKYHRALGEDQRALVSDFAEDLAIVLKQGNPRFDRARFLEACDLFD